MYINVACFRQTTITAAYLVESPKWDLEGKMYANLTTTSKVEGLFSENLRLKQKVHEY